MTSKMATRSGAVLGIVEALSGFSKKNMAQNVALRLADAMQLVCFNCSNCRKM